MAKPSFTHLHVHTDYSLLDGAAKVEKYFEAAVADGNPGLGITDHGTAAVWYRQASLAKQHGIVPVFGYEAYHVPDYAAAREGNAHATADADGKSRFHMTLLATSSEGYHNLMRLTSRAATEQLHGKPLVDDILLAQYSEGLVATSSCLGSRYNQLLLKDREPEAIELLGRYKDLFGPERFFIEVQDHGIEDQDTVTPFHLKHAKHLGIPLLATNDCHYVHDTDASMHDATLAMQVGKKLADENRFRFSSDENFMRTAAQMHRLFPQDIYPDACTNTLLVTEMASGVDILSKGEYLIPAFPVPTDEGTARDFLRRLVAEGAERRYLRGAAGSTRLPREVHERIEYELGVIERMGFVDYFLVVADFVNWAKSQGIGVGPGRGSGAGSIVAYCLNITTVDPLPYDLYFERFLNPDRVSMPDFDIDFEKNRRKEVVAYVISKYGEDRVSYIATYGERKGKSALKKAVSVLGGPVSQGVELAGLFPNKTAGGEITLSQVLGESPTPEHLAKQFEEGEGLRRKRADDASAREAIDLALSVSGLYNSAGIHAAGMLIAPGPLQEYFPIRKDAKSGQTICEFTMGDIEKLGGLKMDFLGLINLDIINRAVALIKMDTGRSIDIENLPLDDPEVYDMLADGDTSSLFQIEGDGITKLVTRLKPNRIEDIAAILALYRPGPMGSDMHTDYADRKNGRQAIDVPHPDFKKIFSKTYGLVVFQEQMMLLAQHYAGFTAAQADELRSATGKKNLKKMADMEPKFKAGMKERGYPDKLGSQLWDMLPPFASYSFNASHAFAYGMITYRTAWLKAHYPAAWAAAYIDNQKKEKASAYMAEARRRGLVVHAPDINSSDIGSVVRKGEVWLGLGGISNCGEATVKALLRTRAAGEKFASLPEFVVRTDGEAVNKTSIARLVEAGAFDGLHPSRAAMVEAIPDMTSSMRGAGRAMAAADTEDDLFADLGVKDALQVAEESFDLTGPDFAPSERLEREVIALGFFVSTHPYALVKPHLKAAVKRGELPNDAVVVGHSSIRDRARVTVYGAVADFEQKPSKKNKEVLITKFSLETGDGPTIKCLSIGRPLPGIRPGAFAWARGVVEVDDTDDEEDFDENTVSVDSRAALTLKVFTTQGYAVESLIGDEVTKAEPAAARPARKEREETESRRSAPERRGENHERPRRERDQRDSSAGRRSGEQRPERDRDRDRGRSRDADRYSERRPGRDQQHSSRPDSERRGPERSRPGVPEPRRSEGVSADSLRGAPGVIFTVRDDSHAVELAQALVPVRIEQPEVGIIVEIQNGSIAERKVVCGISAEDAADLANQLGIACRPMPPLRVSMGRPSLRPRRQSPSTQTVR